MMLKILILVSLLNITVNCQHGPTPIPIVRLIGNLFKSPPRLGPPLPTPAKFTENLLNETMSEITTLSKNFYFRDIKDKDVKFYLIKREKPYIEDVSDAPQKVNAHKPMKIVIHGWQSEGNTDFIKDLVKSYAKIGINSILAVDWQKHSKRNYIHAASATLNLGKVVGKYILKVIKNDKKLLNNIHMLGHSLGAQIAGFAGKVIKDKLNEKIARITALDAAAPIFEFPVKMPPELRLHSSDADYVDAIHTNAGFFGFLSDLGTADFYVNNGGPIQPGCFKENIIDTLFCSHSMSHDIFNKSITTKSLKATSCPNVALFRTKLCELNNKVVMGEHASTKASGTFFFDG